MSWILPSALAIAGVASIVAIALHFIARSRPLAEPLPTARFIPQRPVQARARAMQLSDALLLAIRVAIVLVIGAGVAGPVIALGHGRVRRVVLVDRSRAVADAGELIDSVQALVTPDGAIVSFDSVASATTMDSLTILPVRGSLSTGLAAAIRAGSTLAAHSDSVELAIVSPFLSEELDAAAPHVRDAWPGRIRLVRVRANTYDPGAPHVETAAPKTDAVVAGIALAHSFVPTGTVRLVRGVMTSADTTFAQQPSHVVVHWPVEDTDADWPRAATIDAIAGVASASGVIVGRFPRVWALTGRAVARWADGQPAAVERTFGAGCIRDVAVLLDPASDVSLRIPFRRFVDALLAPCGGARNATPLPDSTLAALANAGPLAAPATIGQTSAERSPWTPWLLALAAGLLLLELAVRRGEPAPAAP